MDVNNQSKQSEFEQMDQPPAPTGNRPVFVQAYPCSGTTLFVTMLNAHSELAMSYEIYQNLLMDEQGHPYRVAELLVQLRLHEQPDGSKWVHELPIGHWRSFVGRARRADVEVKELQKLLEEFHDAGGTLETLDGRLDFIDSLMRFHRDKTGKQIWGGKVAKVPLEELHRRHPGARFLFVVRDGRDVLASRLGAGSLRTTPRRCAREWCGRIEAFSSFSQALPDQTKMVRYESLVTQPERTLRDVCRFLGVSYEDAMLDYHQGDLSLVRNPHGHRSAEGISRGLSRNDLGRWRRDLSPQQVREFEEVSSDLLVDYGYVLSDETGKQYRTTADKAYGAAILSTATGYFPLQFYVDFLKHLKEREDVQFVTYDDLAWQEGDAYEQNYAAEFAAWKKKIRRGELDSDKVYVLLQHDVDRLPELTMNLLRQEQCLGIPSNVMIFNRRIEWRHLQETGEILYADYDLDLPFLRRLQDKHGFVIGYHSNAYEAAMFDPQRARVIFQEDVSALRQWFDIRYFSPHGGAKDPQGRSNSALTPPDELMNSLRWVHNRYTVRFDGNYSDGGLNDPRIDPATRDPRNFVRALRKGKRYRILTHPQYYRDGCKPKPAMVGTPWYDEVLALYAAGSGKSAWKMGD